MKATEILKTLKLNRGTIKITKKSAVNLALESFNSMFLDDFFMLCNDKEIEFTRIEIWKIGRAGSVFNFGINPEKQTCKFGIFGLRVFHHSDYLNREINHEFKLYI